jgi:prophage maintenance system killer protein
MAVPTCTRVSLPTAAALGRSLALNHPFQDGDKRVAHAAMEVFLLLNGYELFADVDQQERLMLDLAAGQKSTARDWKLGCWSTSNRPSLDSVRPTMCLPRRVQPLVRQHTLA